MNKKTKIILAIVVLVLFVAGYFYFQQYWWPVKQIKIQHGLAKPNFPWRNYTEQELNKLYPQIRYADVPTRVTPEETYAKFREALRTNNLEMAVEQLSGEGKSYNNNKSVLEKAYKENKFAEAYKGYPEEIKKEYMYEAIAQYSYNKKISGEIFSSGIDFTKDANGDWKMDSL